MAKYCSLEGLGCNIPKGCICPFDLIYACDPIQGFCSQNLCEGRCSLNGIFYVIVVVLSMALLLTVSCLILFCIRNHKQKYNKNEEMGEMLLVT